MNILLVAIILTTHLVQIVFTQSSCYNIKGYGYNLTIYDYNDFNRKTNEKVCKCKTRPDGLDGTCMPYAYCFHEYDNIKQLLDNTCQIRKGLDGVCCPVKGLTRKPSHKYKNPYRPPRRYRIPPNNIKINRDFLNQAISDGRNILDKHLAYEKRLIKAGIHQQNNTQESFHQGFFGKQDKQQRDINRKGCLLLETSKSLARKLNLSADKCYDHLIKYHLDDTSLWDSCVREPKCDTKSKYRSIDGSCNNLKHPLWGRSMSQFSRLVPPFYVDGIDIFRKASDGQELPGARQLSSLLTQTGDDEHPNLSVLFLQFGQFLDHDMSLTLNTRADTGEGLSCCSQSEDGQLVQHPACKPILIPPDDPFYGQYNQTCLNFVRSVPSTTTSCHLGPREQAGAVSHFIDASQIYGSNEERMKAVRSFNDGKLKVSIINGKEFLPFDTNGLSVVCRAPVNQQCVYAGDIRVNQQFGLIVLQLVFLREHNRIASKLKQLNPNWSDETLYQETRRIVGAQLQWITYNEFLPLTIGRRAMQTFDLLPSPWGFSNKYKEYYNPGILNEFSAAAFRWHTLVQSFYHLMNSEGEYTSHSQLRDIFNDPTPLYKSGAVDEVLYGTAVQPSQQFDAVISEEIKHQLFRSPNAKFGGDLISTNIQRGRDHGLPPYNKVRELCGLSRLTTFNELNNVFRRPIGHLFARLYKSVDDIDLFVAAINEKPLKEGILGPVFGCIVAEQFRRSKEGDRFWFENFGYRHSFTSAQIYEIRKTSLAGIICQNGDDIQFFQPLALMQPVHGNRLVDCSQISQTNLDYWKNENVYG